VLMLENRSCDHMLGCKLNPALKNYFNPDLKDPNKKDFATCDAQYEGDIIDPGHQIEDVNVQLYGSRDYIQGTEPNNQGFVLSYSQQPNVKPGDEVKIMKCFDSKMLPALSTLADNFAVCLNWFASV